MNEHLKALLEHLRSGGMELCEIDAMFDDLHKAVEQGERKRFRRFLEGSAARVAKWPAWKRNILKHSSEPTMSVPRKPVVHDDTF